MKVLLPVCMLMLVAGATIKKTGALPKELQEISGLTFLNDTTLVGHNDSGDSAMIYLLSLKGKIRNKVKLTGVTNVDFEDITSDGKGYLYLGDIGNNENKRKNLVIYKISTSNLSTLKSVTPTKIMFAYPEQKAFPPEKNQFYYDAECLGYYKDSLYIFTKCRTEPFDGVCKVYALPTKTGTYKADLVMGIKIGKRDWYRDAITGGDFHNEKLYLLTYNRIITYDMKNRRPVYTTETSMLPLSQKEALAIDKNGVLYVGDEHHKLLGGGNLYTVKFDKKK